METLSDLMPREAGAPGFKRNGYLGQLLRPDGGYSTELSFDFEHPNGQTIHGPLLVPTLNRFEIDQLLGGGRPTREIYRKAMDHAFKRGQAGQDPFWTPGEMTTPMPKY